MSQQQRSSLQKGCLFVGVGCVSIVVLVVMTAGILAVWAATSARRLGEPTPDPVSLTVVRGTPPSDPAPASEPTDVQAAPTIPAPSSEPVQPTAADTATSDVVDLLHLTLDMQEGRFDVRSGPPGSDVTVEGTYAKEYYELIEEHVPGDTPRERSVVVRFRSTQSLFVRLFGGLMTGSGRSPNRLTVSIPEGLPVDLSLRFGQGQSRIDLGSLTLTDLDADVSMGDHELAFSRPLAEVVPRVRLNGQMGDIQFSDLGNARALDLEVGSSMGDIRIDLGGDWPRDGVSGVSIRHSMGDLRLRIPNDVHLSADSSSRAYFAESGGLDTSDETDDPDAPSLELHLSASMGEARVIRY